jgi:threonine/homoserine/homoserine lactone efflux protein
MTIERWSAFVGVLLVVLCTPGPDFAVVLRHSLADARRGARAAAGIVTGLAGHTTAAALGLSALLAARPDVLVAIRWLGAAYLVRLGLGALRGAFRSSSSTVAALPRSHRPYLDGLAGNLLNPKALLFFLGLIPQFAVPGPGVVGQILLMAGTTVVAAALWWTLVILLAGRSRRAMGRPRVRRGVDAVGGAALMAVAVAVVRG